MTFEVPPAKEYLTETTSHDECFSNDRDHLVVLMHGVMGSSRHMEALSEQITSIMGSRALIHVPSSYSRFSSLKGTRASGDQVFSEMKSIVETKRRTIKFVSLVGYSFGGIVAMWVAGRLHMNSFFGLVPKSFVTVACPHLGAVDDRPDAPYVQRFRRIGIRSLGGVTGLELALSDRNCLMVNMSDPSSPFYLGMAAFERRMTYANIMGDRTVPFDTAYFSRHENPPSDFPANWAPVSSHPHLFEALSAASSPEDGRVADRPSWSSIFILCLLLPLMILWVFVVLPLILLVVLLYTSSHWICPPTSPNIMPEFQYASTSVLESCRCAGGSKEAKEAIRGNLNKLSWAKYGVAFTWRADGLRAMHTHGHIIVRNRMHGGGTDVIRHLATALAEQ